jgi:hypothetical protein
MSVLTKVLGIVVISVGLTYAQTTKVPPNQLKVPTVNEASVQIILPNGLIVIAKIDPATLVLDQSVSPPVLKALGGTTSTSRPVLVRLIRAGTGPWTGLSLSPIVVYRNGLAQWPTLDYTLSSSFGVTFQSGTSNSTDPSVADDIITALVWQ